MTSSLPPVTGSTTSQIRPHGDHPHPISNNTNKKIFLKVAIIALAIIASAAIIATAILGTPILIPVGIAIATIALEAIFVAAYKYISKKTPSQLDLTAYTYNPILDLTPTLDINEVPSGQKAIEILEANPNLKAQDILLLRNQLIKSLFGNPIANAREHIDAIDDFILSSPFSQENTVLFKAKDKNINIFLSNLASKFPSPFVESKNPEDYSANIKGLFIDKKEALKGVAHNQSVLGRVISVKSDYYHQLNELWTNSTIRKPYYISLKALSSDITSDDPNEKQTINEIAILGFLLGLEKFISELPEDTKLIISFDHIQSKLPS